MPLILGQSRRFSVLMGGEADSDDETLSAAELKRMSERVGSEGPRKSRSVARQPDSMRSVNSHRGNKKYIDDRQNVAKKKKRKKKGQKHFPEHELLGKYQFVKYLGHGSY